MKKKQARRKLLSPTPKRFNPETLIIILSLLAIAYYAYSRLPRVTPQPVGINEVGALSPMVSLSLPGSIQANDSEIALDLQIDSGSALVAAVQAELTYDPSKISGLSVAQGDFLTDKLVAAKVDNGKITFVYTAPLGSGGKTGSGKLATLKFKASDDSEIKFSSNTMVAVIGSTTNALKSATGTIIAKDKAPVATPPALTEILTTPTPFPIVAPSNVKATVTPTTKPTPKTTQSFRVVTNSQTNIPTPSFLPEQDFDYNAVAPTSPATNPASDEQPPSGFARFLAWIRSLFTWE